MEAALAGTYSENIEGTLRTNLVAAAVAARHEPVLNCPPVFLTSPQMEETAFHFDGSGYSVVHKSLRATSTSIVLLFKTLSPGGLLLYLASNNTVRRAHKRTGVRTMCWFEVVCGGNTKLTLLPFSPERLPVH